MNQLIKGTARLVTHQERGGSDIQIEIEAEENLPMVSGDMGQLQQAVVALATNADLMRCPAGWNADLAGYPFGLARAGPGEGHQRRHRT